MRLSFRTLVTACFAALVLPLNAATSTLTGEEIAITFGEDAVGYGIERIDNLIGGETTSFVRSAHDHADFWSMIFHARGEDGKIHQTWTSNRAPCKNRNLRKKGNTWTFVWEGLGIDDEKDVLDVTATVRLLGKNAVSWELSVVNRSTKWALFETMYPHLNEVVGEGEADFLVPAQGLGARLYKNHRSEDYLPGSDINYPGWFQLSMAFMKQGKGLFVAPFDSKCRIKRLRIEKNHDICYPTVVENAGLVGKAAEGPRYRVVTAAFAGDWVAAAKLYRKWALRQKWARKGPLWTRADAPKKLCGIHTWAVVETDAAYVSRRIRNLQALYPDAHMGAEWTKWGFCPFDTHYPDLLPTRPGVKETMEEGTKIGFPLMPYFNGRLWDTTIPSWSEGKTYCCLGETGGADYLTEKYGDVVFGVMCPACPGWQKFFSQYLLRVFDEMKFGAVYLDQITCSRPRPCFNPEHGHPVGGGTWWADGERAVLKPVHAAFAAKNVPITSEGAGEYLMDVVDGYELASCPMSVDVPFYTCVYGGYANYFATEIHRDADFELYWTIIARATAWGIAPGLCGDLPFRPGKEEYGKALEYCGKFRERAKDFLVYGHFDDDVHFDVEPAMMKKTWIDCVVKGEHEYSGEFPEVMGAVWKNFDDSRTAVILANLSDKKQKVSFQKPFAAEVQLAPHTLKFLEDK